MLYECALTVAIFERFPPDAEAVSNQALVQVLYGLRRTGLVASLYDGSWWQEVMRRRNAIPERVRPLVLELLKQLFDRGQILPRPKEAQRCPRSDAEWLEESLASDARRPFYMIVTRRGSLDGKPGVPRYVIALEEVLLSPIWNAQERTRRVPREGAAFSSAPRFPWTPHWGKL